MLNAVRGWKTTVILSWIVIAVISPTVPSSAVGVWDPNDTEGRLDIRWVGARYKSTSKVRLTLALYPNFRRRALPKGDPFGRRSLVVFVDANTAGFFFRKNGGIRLSYGDHGSSCCEVVAVRRPNRTTLVARVHPYPFGDEGDPGAVVEGRSTFRVDGKERDDRTATFRLPPLAK